MSLPSHGPRFLGLLLGVLPVLAGCGAGRGFAPACPRVGILGDAADLRRYRDDSRDLTDLRINGRVTGIAGKCSAGEGATLHTELSVAFSVARGPAAASRSADLTYFVAVVRQGDILDKQDLPLHVNFPANTDQVHVTGAPVTLTLPTPKGVSGAAYQVLVGFQLSPAELAENRARHADR